MSRAPLIIAHRGASARAPENTLAAFQMAINAGADGVEFDVQLARDGVPVVIHDFDLRRVGKRRERVADLTSAELAAIDVGSWYNIACPELTDKSFVGEGVPTLRQVLRIAGRCDGPIYIELKSETPSIEALCAAVAMEIRDSNLLTQIIVKSFRLGAIPMMRLLCPDVPTAALFAPNIKNLLARKKHLVTVAREMGADQLSLHYTLATKKICALAADIGMPVTVWTVDNPRWIEKCRKRGIRSLITNDPERFRTLQENVE